VLEQSLGDVLVFAQVSAAHPTRLKGVREGALDHLAAQTHRRTTATDCVPADCRNQSAA
jgi:hypothetical protein